MQITLTQQSRGLVINKAVSVLEKGGIIVYPSDTVYGLAVDATNDAAIERLTDLKGRRPDQKFSYNFSDFSMVEKFVDLKEDQKQIIKKYLPGPLTFIVSGEVSVRIPENSIITDLTRAFGKPTTATSANLTGMPPIISIKSLDAKLYLNSDLIIEDIEFAGAKPSTIVDISEKPYKVIREGDVPFQG
ncbi:MAG: Threonylcarbamoyl-AMP synthase [candidate division WS2 bacterium ADurb.Bin280]|uniref:L-threonylcarbamoyladenylate synthase n=1 Tax=candidate division WS2 bacterium ADurb.Bin280 TaxID=1852829 RepID=A0A1V5SCT1_9BACT|nr:MAG: Threonylcarbamoyl-AMP synthase [candidate division WS2 bacterium ADurb.Bin280]